MGQAQSDVAVTIPGKSCVEQVRRWAVWSVPPRALAFLLVVEVAVLTVLAVVVAQGHVDAVDAVHAALLIGLSTVFSEAVNRVDVLRRYLHLGDKDRPWSNPTSVWTFAAALLLPAGYAALVVAVIYGHILLRGRRHKSARAYRIVFGCASTLAGTFAAVAIEDVAGHRLDDGATAAAVALLALTVYSGLSLAATVTAAYLVRGPSTVRSVLPGAAAVGFEIATLLLGVMTAALVLSEPWLVPAVLVLVAVLHRSTLVNELEVVARTDTKTGLLNATAWRQLAHMHLLRGEREKTPAALLMIDLDHFKRVNDDHGHLAGDVVLRAVADCLKHELRGYDALGRFGGEEFVVLLNTVEKDLAVTIAERLTDAIRALTPVTADLASPLSVTASIGVATYPADGTSIDALTDAADRALYAAKRAGRDRVRHTNDVTHTT